jgi:hypothetical protein
MSIKFSIDSMTDGFHTTLFRDFGLLELARTVDGTVTDDSGSKTRRNVIVAAFFHSEWTRIVIIIMHWPLQTNEMQQLEGA